MSAFRDAVREFKRAALAHYLSAANGNRSAAARLAGMQRTYFLRLLTALEVDRSASSPVLSTTRRAHSIHRKEITK